MYVVFFIRQIGTTDSHVLEKAEADKQPIALTSNLSPFPFPCFVV